MVISNILLTKLKHLFYFIVPTSTFTYPVAKSFAIPGFQVNSFINDFFQIRYFQRNEWHDFWHSSFGAVVAWPHPSENHVLNRIHLIIENMFLFLYLKKCDIDKCGQWPRNVKISKISQKT